MGDRVSQVREGTFKTLNKDVKDFSFIASSCATTMTESESFADMNALTPDFFMNSLVVTAKEGRFAAIGKLDDGTIVVIFAKRGTQGVSVISMRPASPKERRLI